MTSNGTVTVAVGAGAATDAAGNASTAATATDSQVQFNGAIVTFPQPAVIPTTSRELLGLLALVVLALGLALARRD
jgi:hypothetical protein